MKVITQRVYSPGPRMPGVPAVQWAVCTGPARPSRVVPAGQSAGGGSPPSPPQVITTRPSSATTTSVTNPQDWYRSGPLLSTAVSIHSASLTASDGQPTGSVTVKVGVLTDVMTGAFLHEGYGDALWIDTAVLNKGPDLYQSWGFVTEVVVAEDGRVVMTWGGEGGDPP